MEEPEAATPPKLATCGALILAPGLGLTLSARADIIMCPGPPRMEFISWEAAPAGPQNW